MDREEVTKWLSIMKANLNSFPEINCGKKIEALAEAIRLLKNEQSENPTGSTTKNDLGIDCIDHDSAIKALDYDIKCFEFKSGVSKHMDDIVKLLNTIYETQVNNIKALPSVTPIRPKGHWQKIELPSRDAHECSECCGLALLDENNEQLTDFCPSCGADMRGEEE